MSDDVRRIAHRVADLIADYLEGCDVGQTDRYDQFIEWFFDSGARFRRALSGLPATL